MINAAMIAPHVVAEAHEPVAKPGFKAALAKAAKVVKAQPAPPQTSAQAVQVQPQMQTQLSPTLTLATTLPLPMPLTLQTTTMTTQTQTATDAAVASDADVDDNNVTGRIPLITPMPESLGTTPATPLERAVQDLIEAIKPRDKDAPMAMPQLAAAPAPVDDKGEQVVPVAPVHVVTPAPMLEAMSHAHLVVGDGEQRVVLTVAVRGDNVHVALRGNDEHLVAAMARNVATLDDSLRHRGLALAEMTTTDDSHDAKDAPKERVYREVEDKEPESDEAFSLEEQQS